ncbi:hypothetical protein LY76DRAFT_605857 [Colletotrichum caudatum]|nr:hypothetical protein LY76DRAFT_605857 [Colletotrichum caudatum]
MSLPVIIVFMNPRRVPAGCDNFTVDNRYTNSLAASLICKMKLSLKQKNPAARKVENADFAKATIQNTTDQTATPGKFSSPGENAAVTTAQHKKPRRVIRPRPQHATPLDTDDDDDYDDYWLPAYEDPQSTDKIVDNDWSVIKKQALCR